MSFRYIVEFSINLNTFRNIDLFHQGIYKINITLTHDTDCAYPYNFTSKYITTQDDPHQITSTTLEETHINTKSFLVRYFDETVRIDEIYYLRSEIETEKTLQNSHFSLKFDLLFTDLNGKVSIPDIKATNPASFKFEKISTSEFILMFPTKFQSLYVPVIFDDNHFCLLSTIISSLIIDYKFRPLLMNPESDVTSSLVSAVFKQTQKSGKDYIGSSQTDSTYSSLMDPLSKSYNFLRDFYLIIIQKCLTDSQKRMMQFYFVPPILSLPGTQVTNSESSERFTVQLSDDDSLTEDALGSTCRFSQRVASHDSKKIVVTLMAELGTVAGQVFQLWHHLQEIIPNCSENVFRILTEKYAVSQRQLLSRSLIRKVVKSADLGLVADQRKREFNKLLAIDKRKSNFGIGDKFLSFIDKRFEVDFNTQPILFEEFCILDSSLGPEKSKINPIAVCRDSQRGENSNHLIVLVHGFQGSSSDMRIVKNMLYVTFPHNLYLCSAVNESDTESSVFLLGKRLAEEIRGYLKENCVISLGKISFIGHSLGGIVIRAALPHLEEFSNKMHLLLTLSTPHLGIIEGSSKLIRAGMWVLNSFKKSESLKQLSFSDSINIEECALYRLAEERGCEWFSHMVVASSPQDLYSPHYSARIEIIQELEKFGKNTKFLMEMGKMILKRRDRIHRIDVDFYLPSTNFDNFIGRAGHIEFLENHIFMKTLLYLHPEFFD